MNISIALVCVATVLTILSVAQAIRRRKRRSYEQNSPSYCLLVNYSHISRTISNSNANNPYIPLPLPLEQRVYSNQQRVNESARYRHKLNRSNILCSRRPNRPEVSVSEKKPIRRMSQMIDTPKKVPVLSGENFDVWLERSESDKKAPILSNRQLSDAIHDSSNSKINQDAKLEDQLPDAHNTSKKQPIIKTDRNYNNR